MAFPTINFKKTNASVPDELLDIAQEKFAALEHYINDLPSICDVEFEKMTNQQSGNIYRVEMNLEINGKLYRAEATMENFERAIEEVRDELDKELRRAQNKKETLVKRGGRKLKELLRFGNNA